MTWLEVDLMGMRITYGNGWGYAQGYAVGNPGGKQGFALDSSTHLSMIDWISDTRSQGYTNLQSLVECLNHRDIVSAIPLCARGIHCSMSVFAYGCICEPVNGAGFT
jgi:hypothetical protein